MLLSHRYHAYFRELTQREPEWLADSEWLVDGTGGGGLPFVPPTCHNPVGAVGTLASVGASEEGTAA